MDLLTGQEDSLDQVSTRNACGPLIMCTPLYRLGEVNVDEANNGMTTLNINTRRNNNWDRVKAEMVANGATDVGNLGIVFKFQTWQTKTDAQRAMKTAIPWAFFIGAESAAVCGVPAGIPTIGALVLTYYSDAVEQEGGGMSTHDDNFFCI